MREMRVQLLPRAHYIHVTSPFTNCSKNISNFSCIFFPQPDLGKPALVSICRLHGRQDNWVYSIVVHLSVHLRGLASGLYSLQRPHTSPAASWNSARCVASTKYRYTAAVFRTVFFVVFATSWLVSAPPLEDPFTIPKRCLTTPLVVRFHLHLIHISHQSSCSW